MPRSLVKIGRLSLTESQENTTSDSQGEVRTISISGVESSAHLSVVQSQKMQHDINGLNGLMLPVIFQNKTGMNGYYFVESATDEVTWWSQPASLHSWAISLVRVGEPNETDLESRLSGAQTRTNDFGITGERWHAPAIGHSLYFTGATAPSQVTRSSFDGNIVVYRTLPAGVFPRWSCGLTQYALGRCRFLDDAGQERVGTKFDKSPIGWEMSNALTNCRLSLTGGAFQIGCWDSGFFVYKNYDVYVNGTPLSNTPNSCNIIRNDYEVVVVRTTWNISPNGRTQIDFTLRRGSRFVEIFINTSYSAALAITRNPSESSTLVAGGSHIKATANDVNGNKFVLGSLRAFSSNISIGEISKSATRSMDASAGIEFNGSTASVGDAGTALYAQYVGAVSERVIGVRR